eukprot:59203_1
MNIEYLNSFFKLHDSDLREFCKQLQVVIDINEEKEWRSPRFIIQKFTLLINDEYFQDSSRMYQQLRKFAIKYKKISTQNMQCHWRFCAKRRKHVKKLYKCVKCRVSRYCSKKCQKLDWKNGCHKILCAKYSSFSKS